MTKKVPKIIEEVGFDFEWSEEKVWALDIPVEEMDIKELEWHFQVPFWFKQDGFYDLSPNEVMQEPEKHQAEYNRTINSNLDYPLDIMQNKDRWLLLDGLHRLVKAEILGMKKVKVRKIPRSKISEITI